jgi:hypothetical protein
MGWATGHGARATDQPARFRAVDERGKVLQVTSRLDRGFVNVSLWRQDHAAGAVRCVETFHLEPAEVGRLTGFLVESLAAAVPAAGEHDPVLGGEDDRGSRHLTTAPPPQGADRAGAATPLHRLAAVADAAGHRLRRDAADLLGTAARRLRG